MIYPINYSVIIIYYFRYLLTELMETDLHQVIIFSTGPQWRPHQGLPLPDISSVMAVLWLGSTARANPKSHILRRQLLLTSILPGLISLCIIPAEWRYLTPGGGCRKVICCGWLTFHSCHKHIISGWWVQVMIGSEKKILHSHLWVSGKGRPWCGLHWGPVLTLLPDGGQFPLAQ